MTTPARPVFDPDTCERILYAALDAGDITAVEAALRVMTPQDPHRADRLYTKLKTAYAIVAALTPEDPVTDLDPKRDTDDLTEDLIERCRWARLCNDNLPAPGWTAREKIAVFVILDDARSLAQAGFTAEQALQQIADEMLNPPADMDAWLQQTRTDLDKITE